MLTIFTTCAPFEGERARLQKNGILSWIHNLAPTPEILIMSDGREQGVKEFVKEWGEELEWPIRVVPVEYTSFGMPKINSMFLNAQKEATNDTLCFMNSDIIPLSGLMETVKILKKSDLKEFVLTGQRYDVNVETEIDFEYIGVHNELYKLFEKSIFHDSGGDYFMFPKSLDWSNMPPFAAARGKWDTWINGDALERGIPLIRATKAITVLHQNHSSEFVDLSTASPEYLQQLEDNKKLAGTTRLMFGDRLWNANKDFGCDMATHVINQDIIHIRPHPMRV